MSDERIGLCKVTFNRVVGAVIQMNSILGRSSFPAKSVSFGPWVTSPGKGSRMPL